MKVPSTSHMPVPHGFVLQAVVLAPERAKGPRSIQVPRGFVLLEVVLALALFGMVATSLTTAINQIAIASNSASQESRVLRAMESVLAEVSHQLELKPGATTFPPNSEGVAAEAIIEKAELKTKGKARMDHMFRIIVNAWIIDGRKKVMNRRIETYLYAPNNPVA